VTELGKPNVSFQAIDVIALVAISPFVLKDQSNVPHHVRVCLQERMIEQTSFHNSKKQVRRPRLAIVEGLLQSFEHPVAYLYLSFSQERAVPCLYGAEGGLECRCSVASLSAPNLRILQPF